MSAFMTRERREERGRKEEGGRRRERGRGRSESIVNCF